MAQLGTRIPPPSPPSPTGVVEDVFGHGQERKNDHVCTYIQQSCSCVMAFIQRSRNTIHLSLPLLSRIVCRVISWWFLFLAFFAVVCCHHPKHTYLAAPPRCCLVSDVPLSVGLCPLFGRRTRFTQVARTRERGRIFRRTGIEERKPRLLRNTCGRRGCGRCP